MTVLRRPWPELAWWTALAPVWADVRSVPVRAVLAPAALPSTPPPAVARYAALLVQCVPTLDWPVVIANHRAPPEDWVVWAPPWLEGVPARFALESASPARRNGR